MLLTPSRNGCPFQIAGSLLQQASVHYAYHLFFHCWHFVFNNFIKYNTPKTAAFMSEIGKINFHSVYNIMLLSNRTTPSGI